MTERTRPTAEESAKKDNPDTVKKDFVDKGSLNYKFNMPIGDWSDDGHGKTETFVFGCNKPLTAVVEAFNKAAKKLPLETHPTEIFHDYEDHSLEAESYFSIFDAGYDMLAGFNEPEERARRLAELPDETWEVILEYPQVEKKELACYVLWFCQQGDPELIFSEETPAESLFGYGGLREHCGYGLFG